MTYDQAVGYTIVLLARTMAPPHSYIESANEDDSQPLKEATTPDILSRPPLGAGARVTHHVSLSDIFLLLPT